MLVSLMFLRGQCQLLLFLQSVLNRCVPLWLQLLADGLSETLDGPLCRTVL